MLRRLACLLAGLAAACLLLRPPPLAAQQVGVDSISLGPLAVHDHVAFDYRLAIKNDPYPHETREGYAYDGVDLFAAVHWHWGRQRFATGLRLTPVARRHFGYDQDTDFEPGNDATHGNQGQVRSRTFGVDQTLPLGRFDGFGIDYDFGFLRQFTRFREVTTYDLNTDPALSSNVYDRLISERAILYELRSTFSLSKTGQWRSWGLQSKIGVTPMTDIFLHNYVPVILAATSASAYGSSAALAVSHRLGAWQVQLSGSAGIWSGYHAYARFRREEYQLRLEVAPPRWW